MSISPLSVDQLSQRQLQDDLARLKELESKRAQYLKTASKACLCSSIPLAYCHMCLCFPCILSAVGENKPPQQRTLFEKMCVGGTGTYRDCWEGALSPPEKRCDFCCLVFKGVEGCAMPPRNWKEVALLPPERQRMDAICTKLGIEVPVEESEGAPS